MSVQGLTLPESAQLPAQWVTRRTLTEIEVAVPARTPGTESYRVTVDAETRQLGCSCPAFRFRGSCHHVRGLLWWTTRPHRTRGVRDTSLEAYRSLTESDIAGRQAEVYALLSHGGPRSNREIAAALNRPINTVTPRTLELRERGAVVAHGLQVGPTGRSEHVWAAVPLSDSPPSVQATPGQPSPSGAPTGACEVHAGQDRTGGGDSRSR